MENFIDEFYSQHVCTDKMKINHLDINQHHNNIKNVARDFRLVGNLEGCKKT